MPVRHTSIFSALPGLERLRRWKRRGGPAYFIAGLIICTSFIPALLLIALEAGSSSQLIDQVDRGQRADASTLASYLEQIALDLLVEEHLAPALLEQSPSADPAPLPEAVEYLFTVDLDTREVTSGRQARYEDEAAHVFGGESLITEALTAMPVSKISLVRKPTVADIRAGFTESRYRGFPYAYVLRCREHQSECKRPAILQGVRVKPEIVLTEILPQAYTRLVEVLGGKEQGRTTSFVGQPILETSTSRLSGSLHSSMASPEEGITPPEDMHFEVETIHGIAHISPRARATAKTVEMAMSDGSEMGVYRQSLSLGGLFPTWTLHVGYRNSLRESRPARQIILWLALLAILVGIAAAIVFTRRQVELGRMRSFFVSGVSHEFKTPLAVIRNNNEMLRDEDLSDAGRAESHLFIERMVMRLMAMTDNVLTYSKMTRGRLTLRPTEIDFGELVREVVASFRDLFAERRYYFSLNVDGGLPGIKGDVTYLAQVITNLLQNAVKYSDPHTIWVQVSSCWRGDQPHVRFTVRDKGIGIEKDKQNRVFEPFYRADSGHSQRASGNGLGLALVKSIVEAHGGRIELSSREGEGTTVHVTLPVERLQPRGQVRVGAALRKATPIT